MSSKIPEFRTDEELAAFLEQDLSVSITPENFKPARFEFLPKTRQVNLRLSEALLEAVRARARDEGISYQRYIRQAVERALDNGRRGGGGAV
jgi:predicted DNA binding CopG/RHH family protein